MPGRFAPGFDRFSGCAYRQFRRGRNQLPGIRLQRAGAQRHRFAALHQPPMLHYRDARAQIAHQRHGVRDEQVGQAVLALQAAQQVHNLRAHADVKCGDRLLAFLSEFS